MGRYSKIISDIWGDPEFDEKLDIEGKLFYIYLLTNDAANMAGYYRIKPKTVASETGISAERVDELLRKDDIGLWKYDPDTRQIFIKSYMKYNNVTNANQYKGIAAQIKPLAISNLHIDFMNALIKATKGVALRYLPEELLKQVRYLCEKVPEADVKQTVKAQIVKTYINNYLTVTDTDTDTRGSDTV